MSISKSYEALKDYNYEVSKGLVPGVGQVAFSWHNPDVGASWVNVGSIATLPVKYPTGTKLLIASTSVDDTFGGSGANIGLINGLDENYEPVQETFNYDGQTPVETVNKYIRVHDLVAIVTGTQDTRGLAAAKGNIFAGVGAFNTTTGFADNFSQITIGESGSRQGGFTVPANKNCILSQLEITVLKPITGSQRETETILLFRFPSIGFLQSSPLYGTLNWEQGYNLVLPPTTDFQVITKDGNGAKVSVVVRGYLFDV